MTVIRDLLLGEGFLGQVLPGAMGSQRVAVKLFGLLGVPMLGWIGPRVVELGPTRCQIKIRLRRRTRNHIGSMYFGVLCAGADLASGLLAVRHASEINDQVGLIFKDIHGEFKKKVMGDCLFECSDGEAIASGVRRAHETGERVNVPTRILVWEESGSRDEPSAVFQLTLSLKDQGKSRAPR